MARRKLEEESPEKIATGDVVEGDCRWRRCCRRRSSGGDVAEKIVIRGYRHRRRMQKEIAAGEAVAGGDVTGRSSRSLKNARCHTFVLENAAEDRRRTPLRRSSSEQSLEQSLESAVEKIAGAASLFRVSLSPDKISVRVSLLLGFWLFFF
ncbi:hypothetical protein AAHE18_11G133000 [Arachis hypogaea]